MNMEIDQGQSSDTTLLNSSGEARRPACPAEHDIQNFK